MLLVLSEMSDQSTDRALEWCKSMGIEYTRLNDGVDLNSIFNAQIHLDQVIFHHAHGAYIKIDDIEAVWFRRGYLDLSEELPEYAIPTDRGKKEVTNHLRDEKKTLREYVIHKLKEKPSLNSPILYNMNKLIALDFAKKCGMKIPPTLISRNKDDLGTFSIFQGSLITKNIQDVLTIKIGSSRTGHVTTLMTHEDIEQFETGHFYSLFQKAIAKRYELRVFYLDGKCYSCCIFSQNDNQTQIDYRNYNENRPNRNVPYALPDYMVKKIQKFMTMCGLESGSLDIIVDTEGEYYFLEVNPVGQYSYVSVNCNFFLDKAIAHYFKEKIDEQNEKKVAF